MVPPFPAGPFDPSPDVPVLRRPRGAVCEWRGP